MLEWTGERCVPWVDDWQVLYEHLHRYYFAADLADGRRVLDLGSGEGYGSAILAERAKEVLGIEIDVLAVENASTNYPLDNLEFRQSSVLDLDDLPDTSFDLVVCYEVIEHITEHDELLSRSVGSWPMTACLWRRHRIGRSTRRRPTTTIPTMSRS